MTFSHFSLVRTDGNDSALALQGWAELAERTLDGVSELAPSWAIISNVLFMSCRSDDAAVAYNVVALTCHGDYKAILG